MPDIFCHVRGNRSFHMATYILWMATYVAAQPIVCPSVCLPVCPSSDGCSSVYLYALLLSTSSVYPQVRPSVLSVNWENPSLADRVFPLTFSSLLLPPLPLLMGCHYSRTLRSICHSNQLFNTSATIQHHHSFLFGFMLSSCLHRIDSPFVFRSLLRTTTCCIWELFYNCSI